MAGDRNADRFFVGVFGFTLSVMVLVAANHLALFVAAWLGMGLVMADLIGHVRGWQQARAAAGLARRYFLAGGTLVAVAVVALWSETGVTTVSGIASVAEALPPATWLVAAAALLLAAMIQSALVPFHTWLLSSMTAPTPASALMHAGFVNAGAVLLVRFAPVVSADARFMLLVVVVGATSALAGKLLKSVRSDVKGQLGCSTVGQMGFMIMQAGLGFFGAAVTHLILHGFYKAYQFLASGARVEQTAPTSEDGREPRRPLDLAVTGVIALLGGAVFALLTGKGTSLDSGLLLALLVVLTTLHATRTTLQQAALPATARYGAFPLLFFPAIALYGMAYTTVGGLMGGLPVVTAPVQLTVVHAVVAAAFVAAYLAIETGLYRHSKRLYVALLNATWSPAGTVLTSTAEYNDY
jgi:NAD(P)H-quinone oxidoreductase subunit 5